jgi:hypothetical protein
MPKKMADEVDNIRRHADRRHDEDARRRARKRKDEKVAATAGAHRDIARQIHLHFVLGAELPHFLGTPEHCVARANAKKAFSTVRAKKEREILRR